MPSSDIMGLLGFVAACVLVASSGAVFKPGTWYETLAKPWWRPPNWLFAPAWSVLYVTIAVAGWLVWRRAGFAGAALPLFVYGLQLAINAAWSALFFGMRRMDLALLDVAALWGSIVALIVLFRPIDPNASLLLMPYLAWVSFAAMLNYTMWRMNPTPQPAV